MSAYLRRLPQRFVSILAVFVAWLIVYLGAPLWVTAALVADAITDWSRVRWLRLYGFVLGQLTNEVVGVVVLFALWVLSGFGLWQNSEWAQRLNGRVLGWWTHNIMALVCFFMDTTLVFVGEASLLPSPVLVLSRHISFLDAAIPAVAITDDERNTPRHVFMRELRFDPCIEICARRSPNHLVDRKGGPKELAAIKHLGTTLGPHASGVIFPEGGFRTEKRFERAVQSLRRRRPELADVASSYHWVMPPRPGGSWAFLSGATDVDVAVIAHAGFETVSTVRDIIANCPISNPIIIEVRRVDRHTIPSDETDFAEWLFEQYAWVDTVATVYDQTVRSLEQQRRSLSGSGENQGTSES